MLVKFSGRIFDILLLKLTTSLAWHDFFAFAVDFSQIIFPKGSYIYQKLKVSLISNGSDCPKLLLKKNQNLLRSFGFRSNFGR